MEAATGFEPVIKVLQTFALPLGHAALPSILNLYYQKAETGFEPGLSPWRVALIHSLVH